MRGRCGRIAILAERPGHKITDQELLREAVREWQLHGDPASGPNYQIFEQQAAQAYYQDAEATAHFFKRPDDVQWSVVELAKIRAENGDVQGAKDMIRRFTGFEVGDRAAMAIAEVQANSGDLPGALQTAPVNQSDEIMLVFARWQIARKDFAGALKTAERMTSHNSDQVFYEVGDALRLAGQPKRILKLASGMSDRKLAALFIRLAKFMNRPSEFRELRLGPCDVAASYAADQNFAEADALIEQNQCSFVSFVAIHQYAVDPDAAERLLRSRANADDLVFGLNQMGEAAARKGNINESLRFLNDLESLSNANTSKHQGLTQARCVDLVHEIARDWTIKAGPHAVLRWARSRPNTGERTWALIGMAEALGHSRSAHSHFPATFSLSLGLIHQ